MGGKCGERAAVFIKRAGRSEFEPLDKIDSLQVDCGDVLRILTPGGGGYGHSHERDPEHVLQDLLNGLISKQAARALYSVVIEDGVIDQAATAQLRHDTMPSRQPEMFCFGPERDAYESVWTEEAWARLIQKVFSLPVPLRASMLSLYPH